MKENLSIIEIENKKCEKCSKLKTPVKVVSDKLIMFLDGMPTSNEYRPIDHTKYTSIKKGTVVLDEIGLYSLEVGIPSRNIISLSETTSTGVFNLEHI